MYQSRALSVVARVAAALVLVACSANPEPEGIATRGSGEGGTSVDESGESRAQTGRVTSPRRLDRTFPDIRFSGPMTAPGGRAQLFLDITVDIDIDGRPDMKTLRVTGPGAPENRHEISRWIESGVYKAGTDASGRPVRAQYKLRTEVRTR